MPPNNQLPPGIGEFVAKTEATDSDQILALKEQLETTQSALSESQHANELLLGEIKVLRDNSSIKRSAVRYAKTFMIVIPIFCVLMLIVTITQGVTLKVPGSDAAILWKAEVKEYAQAAFVVAPIVFIATVLGFLLKGVFQQTSKEDEAALQALGKSLPH